MKASDFTTALTTLGLDNHQAAQWLGVSVKSVRRYRASGAPGPVAGMVRLALKAREAKILIGAQNDGEPPHVFEWNVNRAWHILNSLALDWRE